MGIFSSTGAAIGQWLGFGQAPASAVVPQMPTTKALDRPSASDLIWVEPSTRIWIDWSPDTIRAAEVLAAAGSYRLAAHLCRSLHADDRIASSLGQRVDGLLGTDVTFDASGDRRRSRRAVRALEADDDFGAMCPETELREFLEWYDLLGIALAQIVPIEANGRLLPRLQTWDPRNLRFDLPTRRWLVRVDGGAEVEIRPGGGQWVLFTSGSDLHAWQRAAWRACSRWWLLKEFARSDWGRYSEVKAGGIFVASANDGTMAKELAANWSPAERRKLAEGLNTLGRDTSIALPRGIDLKIVEAAANTWETFTKQIDYGNTGIAVALLGQNLTTEVNGGSRAAAQVHEAVATHLRRADAKALSTCLHDQLLRWWAAWNFGDEQLAPWPRWDVEPSEDLKARGDGLKSLGDGLSAMRDAGVAVDVVAVCEEHGVALLDPPTLAPPKPPAPLAPTTDPTETPP